MRLTGLAAAALLAVAGNAVAQSAVAGSPGKPAATEPGAKAKETQPRAAPPTPSAGGLTIARDADTGVLRAPTDAEAAALAAPAPTAPSEVVPFVTPSGAIAAQVPEDMLTYTVVSKNPDGTLTSICLPDKQSAETAVHRASATPPAALQSATRSRSALRPASGAPNE